MKIRDLFRRDPTLQDIKVGSVEEFQGQVRKRFPVCRLLPSEYYDMILGKPRGGHVNSP